jgi:hypothetical protein
MQRAPELNRIYATNAVAPTNVSVLRKSIIREGSEAAFLVA